MSAIQWVIPPSTLRWLDQIPGDRPVAMLIRHSVRGPLPDGREAYVEPLTADGHRLALALGRHLGDRLRSVSASPLTRTMQTADRLAEGAGLDSPTRPDTLLGDPGAFVVDDRAGDSWSELGHVEVMRHLVEESEPLPGCADPDAAARFLVHHLLSIANDDPGVHAFATHDSLVTATAARMLGQPLTREDWPHYLEAVFCWEEDDSVHIAYRDEHHVRDLSCVGLTTQDVIAFARREVARTVGLDCPARFFLAGGAFKTLLNGTPPRDLDLWSPSEADRATLRKRLLERGAIPLPERDYTEGFQLGDRVIELPLKTQPTTLEGRLARFDLALSAVGVEHRPGDQWRAVIHPLALESIERRAVLLLDELQNWRHSLASLERMRRYALELNFRVSDREEERIWAIFADQPAEMRRGMIERFERVARHDQGVAEDLARRFPEVSP